MLKNYFKIAWRGFRNNKFYSFINLTGLTIAISVFIITGLYISNELSFDTFFTDSDRIYRVYQKSSDSFSSDRASLPPGLGGALTDRFPEVETMTEVGIPNRNLFKKGEQSFYLENIVSVDPHFFDLFDFEVLSGDAQTALESPGNLLLTESAAIKIFGSIDIIGSTLNFENTEDLIISAILRDPPANSHLDFEGLKSLSSNQINARAGDIQWNRFWGGYVYMKLKNQAEPAALEQKLLAFENAANKPDWMEEDSTLALQPLLGIHLATSMGNDLSRTGNKTLLYLFGGIAVLLLALSCINYMNLSSAKALDRAKEAGVRKTFGALRSQLIAQFLSESVLTAFITLPLSIFLVEYTLPSINAFLGTELYLFGTQYIPFLLAIPVIILLTGLISGSYSAFFLSSINPHSALKNQSLPARGALLRKSLMVFQFASSLFLIISTITIYNQLSYIEHANLGFDKEHVITFSTIDLGDDYETFKQVLQKIPGVLEVSSGPPAGTGYRSLTVEHTDPVSQKTIRVNELSVDYGYIETFGLELIAGRTFSPEYATDQGNAVLLNETALKALGLDNLAMGDLFINAGNNRRLIGVMKDYHHSSFYTEIQPYVISLSPGNNYTGIVRLAPGNPSTTLQTIEKAWATFIPERPFEFNFLDARIDKFYQKEHKLVFLFTLFTGIALLVACLGLLGMSALSAQKRRKEIGIRKVLGASVSSILSLISKDFVILNILGLLVAAPVSYWAANAWLGEFAYSMALQPSTFAVAFLLILCVTLLSVGTQAFKAATINPVDSLKNE